MQGIDLGKKNRSPYLFIAPAVVLILCFMIYPVGNVFYYSLQNYNLSLPYLNGFVGLGNFIKIFSSDSLFYSSLVISLKWVVTEVLLQLIVGLLIALLLNQKFKGRGFCRSALLIPWAISGVLTSMMWSLIFNEHIGVINVLLRQTGLIHTNIAWTGNINTVFGTVFLAELWRGIPFFTIIILAGLQGIPTELYESCAVDGCGWWTSFCKITLPYLIETIILSTLLRTVWEFNSVDLIYTMTGGGPAGATTTLSMYIAQNAINASNFGYGSALVVISFVLLLGFALSYLYLSKFGQEDQL